MTGGGPLFSLRLWGLVCPCFEASENRSARQSLNQLNKLGTAVDWYSPPKKPSSVVAATLGSIGGLFGRSSSNASDSGGGGGGASSDASDSSEVPTRASLKLVDATKEEINYGAPYPQLELKPLPQQDQHQEQQPEDAGGGSSSDGIMRRLNKGVMSYQLDIPLHHVVRVTPLEHSDNILVIITKDVHHGVDDNAQKEACRVGFPTTSDRDAACLDLQVLVEWNKHRCGPDGIEENLPSAGIRQRAQKAAHFAKREIEMREKKRDRERRKASHMQGSTGGLKYTAMAMSNNSS